MSEVSNKAVILVSRPKGPISEDNFKIDNLPYPKISNPSKELIVKLLQCSVDPYMRGRMKEGKSYVPPFELNKPIDGYAILQVIEASEQGNETGFKKGDLVTGVVPFQEYGLINVDQTQVFPLHETLTTGKLPLSYGLSALGMPGMTAWVGFNHLAEPKAGETVLVSAAAGAVGSMVGQLAKIKKCHVVGVAGSDDKVKYICEKLGFDHGFNYKTTSYEKGIEKFCPNGIDIYFDNVGGDALDQAIIHLNKFGRITLCGAISEYNRETPSQGPRLSFLLVGKGAKMQGFIVSYYQHLYPQAADEMAKWLLSGELKIDETEHHGIDSVPRAFIGLMEGENIGKMIVKIAPKQ